MLPKNIRTTFKGGKLNGKKIAVVDGPIADYAIVLARASDEPGERGLQLALVDLKGAGVKRTTAAPRSTPRAAMPTSRSRTPVPKRSASRRRLERRAAACSTAPRS